MTIERNKEWGEKVGADAVSGCPLATIDRMVADNPSGSVLQGGDLALTLGVISARRHTSEWRRLPIDLLEVTWLDSRGLTHRAVSAAWVTIGTFHKGTFVVLANSSFVQGRRVFPRSHPNDGRFEVLEMSAEMPLRQRLAALRRVRSDSHLPHPSIVTRSTVAFREVATSPRRLVIDGRRVDSAREITVEVRSDAGNVFVAA